MKILQVQLAFCKRFKVEEQIHEIIEDYLSEESQMNSLFWKPTVKDKQHCGSVKCAMSKSVEVKSQQVMYAACKKEEKISKIYLLLILQHVP